MSNIGKIFLSDVKRISKNVVAVVVIMGLSILPSLYAWFNVLSNWDPYGPDSTSHLKIAVASEDEGVEIAGISLNVGDSVIEGLESNNTIGWVFLDTEDEAVDGVYSGDYYAAIVIPANFTEDMISFLGEDMEHPNIIYYENEKKNAIAPKITQKAKTTVQQQVNATFLSTLAEAMMKISGSLSGATDADGNSIVDAILTKLNGLNSDLQSYVNILNSFVSIINSAESIVATSQVMMPGLDGMVDTGESSINSMQSLLIGASGTTETVTDMVSYSLDMVNDNLDMVLSVVDNSLNTVGSYESSISGSLAGAEAVMPYLRELFDNSVSSWEDTADDETRAQIAAVRDQIDAISENLTTLNNSASVTTDEVSALRNTIQNEITNCKNTVTSLRNTFTYSVRPQLNATMNSMQNAMVQTAGILNGIDADFGDVEDVLQDYQETLEQGSASLMDSLAMVQELQEGLLGVISDIVNLQSDEQYQELMEILESDPTQLGEFISSPVNLNTVEMYAIENYGSAMAPFYTVLALWVGALILVAIIHVKVEPEENITDVKPYQAYFGRYILFFLVGQVQTLITILGDLYYIRIQCHNPFLFWLAGSVTSMVFTLFIYSLTVAFGNVGEALAVVVMVIQVAGAGGTFPIEVLPTVYQMIYKFLPFPYAMNAMRETIGGIYKMDYWEYIGKLGLYVIVSLVIGLLLAIPFRKLNHMIEKGKERTGFMI
jgi:putative membrane protein